MNLLFVRLLFVRWLFVHLAVCTLGCLYTWLSVYLGCRALFTQLTYSFLHIIVDIVLARETESATNYYQMCL